VAAEDNEATHTASSGMFQCPMGGSDNRHCFEFPIFMNPARFLAHGDFAISLVFLFETSSFDGSPLPKAPLASGHDPSHRGWLSPWLPRPTGDGHPIDHPLVSIHSDSRGSLFRRVHDRGGSIGAGSHSRMRSPCGPGHPTGRGRSRWFCSKTWRVAAWHHPPPFLPRV